MTRRRARPERLDAADLMQYVIGDGGAPWQVGAVLVLGARAGASLEDAKRLFAERVRLIPRFRQKLYRPPPSRGRPYWADAPAFDARAQITELTCPPPGDERALLDLAAAFLARPLPADRPPWSATFVTGLADGRTGLVIVVDHVLTDGVAGLAVLGGLADVPPAEPSTTGQVHRDGDGGSGGRRLVRAGLAEMGGARLPHRVARTSLNRPTGPGRRIEAVAADLAAVREFAHAHGGTVNDVVLAAVAGALRTLLAARGEALDAVTISVPVSARPSGADGELGNEIGVMPVAVPTGGDLGSRVAGIAAVTRAHKVATRGSSAALLVPAFLLLARIGLLRWFINHQRIINTFVTNLRGPAVPLSLGGRPVEVIIPVPAIAGNVTVTFGVLSYAGTLRITLLSDPARVPDSAVLAAALTGELGVTAPGPRSPSAGPV